MASLDVSRKEMVLEGREGISNALKLRKKYLKRLKEIPKIEILDIEYAKKRGFPAFDPTKLVIKVSNLGITGFQAYRILFDKYNIQLELAETYLILAIITKSTTEEDFINLIKALREISKKYKDNESLDKINFRYSFPNTFVRPRVGIMRHLK